MAKCPKCESRLPFFPVVTLTNGRTISCPSCNTELQASSDNNTTFWMVVMLFGLGLLRIIDEPFNYIAIVVYFAFVSIIYYQSPDLEVADT